MAASIQEFAIKFGRNLDELYQNWLCTFDALLMHFSKVHQKCIKSTFQSQRACILYHHVSLDEEQLDSLKHPKDFPKHTAGPSR